MPTTMLTDADFTDGQIGVLTLLVKCGLASSNAPQAARSGTPDG